MMNDLAGDWKCVSAVNDGKVLDLPTVENLRLNLTERGGFRTTLGNQVLFDSTCSVDREQSPWLIDMIGTEGANQGKAALGIVKLEGDKLTLCYTMPGADRPTVFQSDPGSLATLVVWTRD